MLNQLEAKGYSVFEWSDPPGSVYPMHEHSTDQSNWIVSGHLEWRVEGLGTIVLSAGDRDVMPAKTRHAARVIGLGPVRYLTGERPSAMKKSPA